MIFSGAGERREKMNQRIVETLSITDTWWIGKKEVISWYKQT